MSLTRLLFLTPSVAVILGGLLPPTAVAVRAADPAEPTAGPAATSTLQTAQPNILTPDDDDLTLSGTVENTGDETLHNVQVLPRFSRYPLESRDDIRRVATAEDVNWGARYQEGYQVVDESLAPGERHDFTVTVTTELLDFAADGVYAVGIDVMGSPSDSEARIRLHTSRTVVPWITDGEELPSVPVAVLWPLAARPSLLPDGTLLDDSLAAFIGAGGSLSAIVQAGSEAPLTWAVDPDLLDTVDVMADGYQVASQTGPVDGSQANSDAAAQWRLTFGQATNDAETVYLPYAVPDVASVLTTEPGLARELSQRSFAVAADRASSDGRTPGVAWLESDSVTEEVLTTLAETGAEKVIVPGNAVAGSDDEALGRITAGENTLEAVLTDVGLTDAIADAAAAADPRAGALDIRQRWLAETAMTVMEAAADDDPPGPLIAAPPLRWRPDPATAQAVVETWTSIPWVEAVTLGDVEGSTDPADVTPQPAEATNILPDANVAATARLDEHAARYNALLADPDDVAGGLALAAVRASSTGWRDDPAAGATYTTGIVDDLSASLRQVSVTVPESVTLSSRTGSFPLTVTNNLPQAVTVGLDIHSTNVDRLRIEDVTVQRIEPGERALVPVTAQAAANGKVPIEVQLTTGDGSPIGLAQETIVNATDYGTVGWVIVGAAGVLFAAALIRRSARKRRPADEPVGPAEAEPVQEATR